MPVCLWTYSRIRSRYYNKVSLPQVECFAINFPKAYFLLPPFLGNSAPSPKIERKRNRDFVLGLVCPSDTWGYGWPGTNEHLGLNNLSWCPTPLSNCRCKVANSEVRAGVTIEQLSVFGGECKLFRWKAKQNKAKQNKSPVYEAKASPRPLPGPACSLPLLGCAELIHSTCSRNFGSL